jgi:hypothetical protein
VFAKAMNTTTRPGSKNGAEMDWDVLGTCEGLRLLAEKDRNKVSRTRNNREGERISPRPFQRTGNGEETVVRKCANEREPHCAYS